MVTADTPFTNSTGGSRNAPQEDSAAEAPVIREELVASRHPGHRNALSGDREFVISWGLVQSCSDVHATQNSLPSGSSMTMWSRMSSLYSSRTKRCRRVQRVRAPWLGSVAPGRACPTDLHQPRGCRYGLGSPLTSPLAPAALQSQVPCPQGR